MREIFRPVLLMSVVLLVPIVPFLFFGPQVEALVDQWKDEPMWAPASATLVVAAPRNGACILMNFLSSSGAFDAAARISSSSGV